MVRFASVALSASLILNSPAGVMAQPAAAISSGQRVRITNDDGEQLIGTVVALTSDTVRLTDGSRERTINLADARRVEVSSGSTSKGSGAKKGAIRWGLIMGAVGAVALGLQHDEVGTDGSSAGEAAALGLWSGGLFGGLIGAGVGAARAGEQWKAVWP